MRLRITLCLVLVVSMVSAAQSAIILTRSDDPGTSLGTFGGMEYFQQTISAEEDAGGVVNFISAVSVSGTVHQVWTGAPAADTQTPKVADHVGIWDASWPPFDTYILTPAGDISVTLGTGPFETNGHETVGDFSPVPMALAFGSFVPQSGFGPMTSNGTDGYGLTPAATGPSVAFLQVVGKGVSDNAFLSVRIDGFDAAGDPISETFTDFVVFVPEPSSIALVGLALIGMIGYIRRR